jgi:hypothetical protein
MTAFILRARRFLRRIDPNDGPHAEPLSVPAQLTVLVRTGVGTYFLRWKIQPMRRPQSA